MVSQSEKKKLIDKARDYIFSTGFGDGSAVLAHENMAYGIAKFNYVLKKFGLEANCTFISTPDEGITRNAVRWKEGVAYGGKITWGNGKEKFTILDVKPNCCGMLVGGLSKQYSSKDVLKRLAQLEHKKYYIDDIELLWDFSAGNHFIDLFRVDSSKIKLPENITIMHGGCQELKGDNIKGFGLYWNTSKWLQGMMQTVKTPFGPVRILTGSDAVEYWKFHNYAVEFSNKRRELAYKQVFDGKKIIANNCHQNLTNMNEIQLGCQEFKDTKTIYPVSIRADTPSYLVRGIPNFSNKIISELGWKERAQKLGVLRRIRKANLLPHGSGYSFPDVTGVKKIYHLRKQRFFELKMANTFASKLVADPKAMAFGYRGDAVIDRIQELQMAEKVADLQVKSVIKI